MFARTRRQRSVFAVLPLAILLGCQVEPIRNPNSSLSRWDGREDPGTADIEAAPEPAIEPNTFLAAGRFHESRGQTHAAIDQYRNAVAAHPNLVEAHNRLGICYMRLGKYDEAQAHLLRAVALTPDKAHLRNNLAFCYISQRRWSDAEAELRNAIELSPKLSRAHVNLAVALAQQDRMDEALAEFRAVLREDDVQYNMGLMLSARGRYVDAEQAFRAALAKNPQMVAAAKRLEELAPLVERERAHAAQAQPAPAEHVASAAAPDGTAPAMADTEEATAPEDVDAVADATVSDVAEAEKDNLPDEPIAAATDTNADVDTDTVAEVEPAESPAEANVTDDTSDEAIAEGDATSDEAVAVTDDMPGDAVAMDEGEIGALDEDDACAPDQTIADAAHADVVADESHADATAEAPSERPAVAQDAAKDDSAVAVANTNESDVAAPPIETTNDQTQQASPLPVPMPDLAPAAREVMAMIRSAVAQAIVRSVEARKLAQSLPRPAVAPKQVEVAMTIAAFVPTPADLVLQDNMWFQAMDPIRAYDRAERRRAADDSARLPENGLPLFVHVVPALESTPVTMEESAVGTDTRDVAEPVSCGDQPVGHMDAALWISEFVLAEGPARVVSVTSDVAAERPAADGESDGADAFVGVPSVDAAYAPLDWLAFDTERDSYEPHLAFPR